MHYVVQLGKTKEFIVLVDKNIDILVLVE